MSSRQKDVCSSPEQPLATLKQISSVSLLLETVYIGSDWCRYDAPTKIDLPFNIIGLVAFELFAMHFVETKRGLDLKNPGSQVP